MLDIKRSKRPVSNDGLTFQGCILKLLMEKKLVNKNYSLRALARDLGIDSSDLVKIIKNKKRVSPQIAYKIGRQLKLNDAALLGFIKPTLQ